MWLVQYFGILKNNISLPNMISLACVLFYCWINEGGTDFEDKDGRRIRIGCVSFYTIQETHSLLQSGVLGNREDSVGFEYLYAELSTASRRPNEQTFPPTLM